jgi:hypothetical protein
MKVGAYILALSICVATAQETTPPPSKKPAAPGAPAQTKTMVYKGVLIDASCMAPTVTGQPAPTQGTAEAAAAQGSANRLMGDCALSSGSTQLGIKLDDGRTVQFDLVGNERAQNELKANRRWRKNLAARRPIRATVVGVLNGDRLVVTLIH